MYPSYYASYSQELQDKIYHLSSGFSSRTRLPEPSIDAISSQAPKTVHSISSVLEGHCLHSARASNILDSISHAPLPHLSCQYINKNLLTRGKWIISAHYLHTQQRLPIRHVYNNIRQSGIGLTENWRNNSYSPIFFTSPRHRWIPWIPYVKISKIQQLSTDYRV